MGVYVNPGNSGFASAVNSKIYVDKTGLIEFTNSVLDTEQRFICVSRPRRFGKSMAAKMLSAYYSRNCDSRELFKSLNISKMESFEKELNKNNVIYIDVQWFRSVAKDKGIAEQTVSFMQTEIIKELIEIYPDIVSENDISLPEVLVRINNMTSEKFIIIIDEWDCLFREDKDNTVIQDVYINFLRSMFKGVPAESFVRFAYVTGILPIKKYGTQSALNNFDEYTMVQPAKLAEYVGFTESEVRVLCHKYGMDFDETKHWYDGYSFNRVSSVYSPNSVVKAMRNEEFGNYWTETETYETLKVYINMNFDGLRDSIIIMLGGGRCKINTKKFQNDMTSFDSKDDVLTLLIHLGYLAFDLSKNEVYIPNQEIADEFENAIEDEKWEYIAEAIKSSEELLDATLRCDELAVAKGLDAVHMANSSVLAYNNELSLSCAVTIAYFSARKDYTIIRELPAGKGFADIAFIPRKHTDKPAFIVELKWDKLAQGAIRQIKEKRYASQLDEYKNNLLLVGISYDKSQKKHECVIERYYE